MTDQRMPYGVAIHDSIKRGNVQEMQQLLVQARAVYQQQGGDLGQAIQELEGAIQRGGGGVIRPLYGVTIYDAIKRGNQDELQQLLKDARATIQEQGDISNAVAALEAAIQGGVGQTMPYGVAIYDAIRRNDRAAMQSLLDQARDMDDPSIAAAVKELQAALQ